MKWSIKGARTGFTRFSIRRATLEALNGDISGEPYSRLSVGSLGIVGLGIEGRRRVRQTTLGIVSFLDACSSSQMP
jgi:hypothetical protein